MIFNPFDWNEVEPNEEIEAPKGSLRVRLSAPCPLYVSAQGYEALAGVSSSFDIEVSEEVTFHAVAPDGVRMFVAVPPSSSVECEGEVFTNIDRMVQESGSVQEVTRALRQLELARRASVAEIRRESAAARALLAPAGPSAVLEPAKAPAPAPEPASE